jgi:peptidoglycan/LPS O-acetylase OafA/YrhL
VSKDFSGYANGVVALFFVLSGYGIFHSLEGKLNYGRNIISLQALLVFYWSRALRIFPLYWLFLLLDAYVRNEMPHIGVFFANPQQQAPGVGWFVTLLVQCYLLAPFLYIFLKKVGTGKYTATVLTLLFLVYVVSLFDALPDHGVNAYYRHVFLGHIFIFSLGMVLPSIISVTPYMLANRSLALLSFTLFLVTVYYTRFSLFWLYVGPFFILSTFATCFFIILRNPRLPLAKILILLGTYSYSIYLLHPFFYKALEELDIIQHGDLKNIVFTLLSLPVFILICVITEKYTNKIVGHLSNWTLRWYRVR